MENQKATVMIIEDDLDVAEMLSAYFRVQEYQVLMANWGEDGVETCLANRPDIVILDIQLPDIDGFEVARRLRVNRRTQDIPIIFLTERRERVDRLKGLELHADDYITKPFDIQELRLRVRNALQRSRRGPLANPVTSIPEGNVVDERLGQYLRDTSYSLLVISLKNLEKFRDIYGFVASDDLLRAVTLMIEDSLRQEGGSDDFLGHLTPTDFLVITLPTHIISLKKRISNRLKQSFDYFYRDQDRQSEQFQQQYLDVQIHELTPGVNIPQNLQQLKVELDRLCRQESH